jgi:hypothetical protein
MACWMRTGPRHAWVEWLLLLLCRL